jgi:hypothetical protein
MSAFAVFAIVGFLAGMLAARKPAKRKTGWNPQRRLMNLSRDFRQLDSENRLY